MSTVLKLLCTTKREYRKGWGISSLCAPLWNLCYDILILFYFSFLFSVRSICNVKLIHIVLDEVSKNVSILELVKYLELDVLIIPQVKWNINVLVFVCVCVWLFDPWCLHVNNWGRTSNHVSQLRAQKRIWWPHLMRSSNLQVFCGCRVT